jgi:hypothetical protein
MIVYLTVNKVSGSFYVGITNGKKKGYIGSGTALLDAVRSYGKKNFRRFTLEKCKNRIHASDREVSWITRCKKKWPGRKCYNLTTGGENSYSRAKEVGDKIAKKLKRYYADRPELRKMLSERAKSNIVKWAKENGGPANRKITKNDILYIRAEYSSYRKTCTELAREFGVNVCTINNYVLLKKRWRGSGNGQAKLWEPQDRDWETKHNYL